MSKLRIGITQNIIQGINSTDFFWGLEAVWSLFAQDLDLNLVPILPNKYFSDGSYFDGYILSGGKMSHEISDHSNPLFQYCKTREQLERDLLKCSIKNHKPVLGVCRGFQIVNLFFGGSQSKIDNHAGVSHSLYPTEYAADIKLPSVVNSYHNYAIRGVNLGNQLEPLAVDRNGNVELAKHENLNVLGIMWHPERDELMADGQHDFIKKFFHND